MILSNYIYNYDPRPKNPPTEDTRNKNDSYSGEKVQYKNSSFF